MAVIHLPNIHPLPGQGDGTAFLINPFSLEGKLNKKSHDFHKNLNGHVGIIGGSIGMTGAPIISGYSALRGGAGLVTLVVKEDIYPLVVCNAPPELMVVSVKDITKSLICLLIHLALVQALAEVIGRMKNGFIAIRSWTSRH